MPIGRLHHVVLDTPDPGGSASFWSEVLGHPVTYRSAAWTVVAVDDRTSGLAFQLAPDHDPPTWPDPARPMQIHLDVMVDDLEVAHRRVLALGARPLLAPDSDHVYADPAGHPFCLVRRPGWAPVVDDAGPFDSAPHYPDRMKIPQVITVTGQGSVRTPVDRVELSVGVEIDRPEPGVAFQAAAASVSAVLSVLADAGVDSRHVRTTDLRLGPRTHYQDGREVVLGYVSGQHLIAVTEGLAGVPRLLGDLAMTGIEGVRFDGISFRTGDTTPYLSQARELAMADAHRKAADYARLALRELGPVLSVSESPGGGGPLPVGKRAMAMSAEMAVAPGESATDVSVEVVFGLI
ncbi:MAG: SIMPL domain-containing protein [Nakamurella sp.]